VTVADRVFGDNIVPLDLIDDLHADAVTFHNALGDELHRAPIVGRESIVYHYDGPEGRTVQSRVWVGDECVYEGTVLAMYRGCTYMVSFDV
jgi:hypothetical protein